jgi:RNA recognition motif-containing protein
MSASNEHDLPLTVEGHSIYIRNLPLNVTVAQLETEFKKFGPIKPGGIQVRNNKVTMKSLIQKLLSHWIIQIIFSVVS